jgi:S-adenosylmethionine hydrolase
VPRPVIALLTDFGVRDHYVGTMKGVVLAICPDAALVDISHEIPPQDVAAAAMELAAAYRFFPTGTVFLCVVDPGVGSVRRPLAATADGYLFVAPDNGLLSLVLGDAASIVELANAAYRLPFVSKTFEGRDRFAPAAAWLARGTALADLGPAVPSIARLSLPQPRVLPGEIHGEVLRADRFGNLITNVDLEAVATLGVPSAVDVTIGMDAALPFVTTYADVDEGALCALVGSSGYLEVACRGGSAAERLALGRGAAVHLARRA